MLIAHISSCHRRLMIRPDCHLHNGQPTGRELPPCFASYIMYVPTYLCIYMPNLRSARPLITAYGLGIEASNPSGAGDTCLQSKSSDSCICLLVCRLGGASCLGAPHARRSCSLAIGAVFLLVSVFAMLCCLSTLGSQWMGCHNSTLSSRVAFPTRASSFLCSRSVFMFYRHEQLPPSASKTLRACSSPPCYSGYVAVAFLLGRDQCLVMF
ncbi:hypothetical protein F5Y06DRAFT_40127 [Hypoxylon sp. FL0890]|nr:hypothetical protein F5Y06DRAFT_40127 [Hypoxylon sp. FL0890]